jgi:hypothetical protein
MNRLQRFSLMASSGLFAFFMASATFAQMGMRMSPEMRGLWKPVVGGGATYETTHSDGQKSDMQFAIVAKDSVDGKGGVWMEMVMNNPRLNGEMVVKYFVTVDGDQMQMSKMIMQMPGRPPMIMPENMSQGRKPLQYQDIHNNADNVGSESVNVPAGTFQCEHWHMKDGSGDAWVSDKVSPFGLVKYQGTQGNTMVLTKTISDAKDKINGTPVPFDPMKMMPQSQQPQ